MAGPKTDIVAKRDFPYSHDGFTILQATKGDIIAVNSDLVQGLVDEGYAKVFDGGSLPAKPAPAMPQAIDDPAVGTGAPPPAGDPVVIPDGWRDLHHLKMIPLAKQIDPSVSTKADAIAAIEKHLAG